MGNLPGEVAQNADRTCETWMSGKPIKADRAVAVLRMAGFQQGLNRDAFSMRSMRAGGVAALYRATGNIELVARTGRCKTSSISAYHRAIRDVTRRLGRLMAGWGRTYHRATRDLIPIRPKILLVRCRMTYVRIITNYVNRPRGIRHRNS